MAVVVEIADTSHLAYSPLNEKHNILYYRARHNVNLRHIQKPWFDLNPFLERDDDKGLDLERYRPENDRGVLPLESLIIVEDYFSDKPLLTNEFKIGAFWDFLFSNSWCEGYSVRVLEGRLQHLVFTALVSMIHSGDVVQHSTVAFAKNRRQRYSVYKNSQKEPELGSHEETLLLEFIYYGHSMRVGTAEPCISSAGYPDTTTTYSTTTNVISTELESSDQDESSTTVNATSIENLSGMEVKPPTQCGAPSGRRQKLLKRRVRISRDAPGRPTPATVKPLINKSVSRVQEGDQTPCQIARCIPRKENCSNFSSASDDVGYIPPKIDLNRFMCTEKVSYLGEFDLSDDSSYSSGDDETWDYGQEYYLGDRNLVQPHEVGQSAKDKLKIRKAIIKQERKTRKNKPVKPEQPECILPKFSELDVNKYLLKEEIKVIKKEPERVPDLDEYIQILKRDERNEARLKYKTKIKNMVRKKMEIVIENTEQFADEVGGVTDSRACRLHCYGLDPTWKNMPEAAKKQFLLDKVALSGGKVNKAKKKVKREQRKKKKIEIPYIFITTVSGITYMHPVSKLMLQKRRNEQQTKQKKEIQPARRRLSLLPSSPTALVQELKKRQEQGAILSESHPRSLVVKKQTTGFPKAKPLVSGMESPDIDSDDETDDLEISSFDTKRLHVRYSLERIRRSNAEKKKKTSQAPNIFQVLRKYYRMQSILKAFTPGRRRSSVSNRRSSVFMPPALRSKGNKGLKNKGCASMKEKEEHNVIIGKLKWFPFLDTKRKLTLPIDDQDEPLFENYPMDKFRENVDRALKEFVVRREVVISDYSTKASVSITFTKKSVFTKSKFA